MICTKKIKHLPIMIIDGDRSSRYPKRSEFREKGVLFLNTTNIVQNRLDITEANFVSPEKFSEIKKGRLQRSDIVMTTRGSIGKVALFDCDPPEGLINAQMLILRADGEVIDQKFLFYHICSDNFQTKLKNFASGSAQPQIPIIDLKEIEIAFPPLPTQRKIAAILSKLDDKIELNHQMNETLAAIVQAIFKSWFVDFDPVRAKMEGRMPVGMDAATATLFPSAFQDSPLGKIPEGWEVTTVGEEFNLTMGQSPPGSTYNEEEDGPPFYQGRKDFGFRYPTRRVYCNAPTRFAKKSDTLVSVRAPVGDINMAAEKCCIGRGLAAIRHKTGSRSYTYYAMQFLREDFTLYEAEGTVFGAINKTGFQTLSQLRPSDGIIEAFERLVYPFDQSIENNENQSRTLSQIRDALLPKLISGELDVSALEIDTG